MVFLKLIIDLAWMIWFLYLVSKLWDSILHSIHRSIVSVRLSPVKCLFDLFYFSFLSLLWLAFNFCISISLLSSIFIAQIDNLNSCSYWCSLRIYVCPFWFVCKKKKTAIIVLSGVLSRSFSLGAVTVELITFGEDKLSFFFFFHVRWFCPRIRLSGKRPSIKIFVVVF